MPELEDGPLIVIRQAIDLRLAIPEVGSIEALDTSQAKPTDERGNKINLACLQYQNIRGGELWGKEAPPGTAARVIEGFDPSLDLVDFARKLPFEEKEYSGYIGADWISVTPGKKRSAPVQNGYTISWHSHQTGDPCYFSDVDWFVFLTTRCEVSILVTECRLTIYQKMPRCDLLFPPLASPTNDWNYHLEYLRVMKKIDRLCGPASAHPIEETDLANKIAVKINTYKTQ